jgi:hypothetical protein
MTARFGTSRGAYPNTTSARVDTYTGGDMCDQPAQERGFMTPGLIWVADMTKLLPGTKYYYQVGDQVRIGLAVVLLILLSLLQSFVASSMLTSPSHRIAS